MIERDRAGGRRSFASKRLLVVLALLVPLFSLMTYGETISVWEQFHSTINSVDDLGALSIAALTLGGPDANLFLDDPYGFLMDEGLNVDQEGSGIAFIDVGLALKQSLISQPALFAAGEERISTGRDVLMGALLIVSRSGDVGMIIERAVVDENSHRLLGRGIDLQLNAMILEIAPEEIDHLVEAVAYVDGLPVDDPVRTRFSNDPLGLLVERAIDAETFGGAVSISLFEDYVIITFDKLREEGDREAFSFVPSGFETDQDVVIGVGAVVAFSDLIQGEGWGAFYYSAPIPPQE